MGHGFGGCTAIAAAIKEDKRISHVIALDPWLFALHKEILDDGLKLE